MGARADVDSGRVRVLHGQGLAPGAVVQAVPVPKRVRVSISPADADRLAAVLELEGDLLGVEFVLIGCHQDVLRRR